MSERRRLPRRCRGWRWIFGGRNEPIAVIEVHPDGLHAIVGGKDVGTFTSEAAAKLFVEKLRGRADAEDDGR
jgi:hypothetical protein